MDQASLVPNVGVIENQQQVEQVVVENLSLDKKLELAKKINYYDQYEQGRFIDAMDTVNQWCLAEIVQVDQRTLTIHFDGWSSKWDIFYKMNSYKVAPFRKHSRGYTGQNKVALRKLHFNLEDLHKEKVTVEKLIESDLNGLGAFETTQYLRGRLYVYVDFLLGTSILNEEQIDAVNDFLYTVLRLIVVYLKKLPKLVHLFAQIKANYDLYMIDENIAILQSHYELFDILKKMFCCCHRSMRFYMLYDKNALVFEKPVAVAPENVLFEKLRKKDEEEYDIDELKENVAYRKNLVFGQFINFVNYFAELSGFDAILDVLRFGNDKDDTRLPLEFVSILTAPFKNCNSIFSQTFTEQFVTMIKEIVFGRIRNMSEKEIKEIDKEVVSRVLSDSKDFLTLHYSEAETSELVESNQLYMAHRFLRSTYLEKRLKGLNHIKNMIDKIEYGERMLSKNVMGRAGDQDQEMNGGHKMSPPKWLTAEYLKKWIIDQKVLDTAFGEGTHLEIVKRAGCLLKFLARQGALPLETVDLIWKCQLGKHEEMVRVIYTIIKDLVPHISEDLIDQFFSKIQTVPPKMYDEMFLNFLKDFTMKALENFFEIKNNDMSMTEAHSVDFDSQCDLKEQDIIKQIKENMSHPSKGLTGKEKLYGLPIFWELIQDRMSATVSNELLELALTSITETLKQPYSKHIRMAFILKSIENLIKGESLVQSIIITQGIISEYPEFGYSQTVVNRIEFICQLQDQIQIVETLIKNILSYHAIVKEKLKTVVDKKKPNGAILDFQEQVFIGRHNHGVTLIKLLEFLEFLIIDSSNKVLFGINNIEVLWKLFIQQPNSQQEQSMFLKWINKPRTVQYNNAELFLFSSEEKKFFFTKILCNPTYIDFKHISMGQVKCFHKYFLVINKQEDLIVLRNGKTLQVIDFTKLIGLDTLWHISIECDNEKVRQLSQDLLVDLHLKFDNQVPVETQKQIWVQFVEGCMQIIARGGNEVMSAIQCVSKFIDRYDGKRTLKPEMKISAHFSNIQPLNILVFNKTEQIKKQVTVSYFQTIGFLRQKIAEAYDLQISEFGMQIKGSFIDPEEDDDKYIKDIGQISQVLIGKLAHYSPENHPKNIISNSQAYFDKLFSILSTHEGSLIEPTWELLMKLPINAKLQLEIKELTSVQKDPASWSQILDPKSTYKLLYSLKIVNSLNMNKKDPKTIQWRAQFVKLGGFKHLLGTFLTLDIQKIETTLTLKCIELLINILFEFLVQDKSIAGEIIKNKESFILKCVNLLDLIGDYSIKLEQDRGESYEDIQKRFQQTKMKKNKYKSYMTGNKGGDKKTQAANAGAAGNDDDEDTENSDSHQLQVLFKQFNEESNLIKTIFNFLYQCVISTDPTAIIIIPQYPNLEEMLLKTMLKSENFCMRMEMAKKMKEMIGLRTGTQEMKHLLKIVEILLMKIETHTTKFDFRCFQFYECIGLMIDSVTFADLQPLTNQMTALISTLSQEILNREIKEMNSQDIDHLLKGKMILLKGLLQKLPLLKQPVGKGLLPYLLHNCLFEIPNGGGQAKQLQMGQGGAPKCKNYNSRASCVRLIAILCRDCIPNLAIVLKYLNFFNENPSWRTNKEHDWTIALRETEKSSTGYVGIKNLGCICYMNSLFQQLFMLPSLRNDILSVKNNNPNGEEKEENMLFQLQLLFTGLLKSEKQYVNPKGFCHAFKDWEGNATNVLEQMDVEEFFNMFMDRLETAIKGNPQDKTVQFHFGGKYTHEMICKGCPHTYERQEPFLALSVQVKNKKSIMEGLQTFIQGDMLEGENAYLCEKCDKKVDTLKRTSIKKLPRYLIIALKRFEFDFDRMVRVKLNDYCEFPIDLNMEPFTQEGLAAKEKAAKSAENKEGEEESQQQNQEEKEQNERKFPDNYYMYSLSGIVVHTGTADSGHYYSFIKDKDKPDSNKWYEMNDSIVRDFDPNDIPSECYGGEDTFSGYNMQSMKSMKWRNAYLLFYERKNQDDLDEEDEEQRKQLQMAQQQQNVDIQMQSSSSELSEIDLKIAYENQKYWQNRFLFGNEYHEFIYDLSLNWNTSCLIPKHFLTKNDDFHITGMPKPQEYISDQSIIDPFDEPLPLAKFHPQQEIELMEFNTFKLTVGFYIGILQRSHNRGYLPSTLNLIKGYINKNLQCATWIIEEFCNEQLIEENLLQNPQKEMRKFITGILYCAMLKVYPVEKDRLNLYWKQPSQQSFTILGNMILIFIKNMYDLKRFVSHNPQYFQVLARFSTLGPEAREFLFRARIIGRLMDYFFDDVSPYKEEFRSMNDIQVQLKEKPDIGLPTFIDRKQLSFFQERLEIGRQKRMAEAAPKYKYLIEIISNCIRASKIGATRSPYQLDDLALQIQPSERDIYIPEAKFLKKIFSFALRTRSINSICKGYCHYTWNDSEHWLDLFKTVLNGLNEHDFDEIRPYLMLTQYMLQAPAECQQTNGVDTILTNFLGTVKGNATYFKFMETILDFIFKITARMEHVRQWFYANKQQWEWLVDWIKEYKLPPNPISSGSSMRLFKKRGNANYMQMQSQMYKVDQNRATALFYYRTKRIQALLEQQPLDLSGEPDIDLLDMQDHKFVIGEAIDVYARKFERVNTYIVENVLDEMVYMKSILVQSDGNSLQNWYSCDTDKLMPKGAVQSQHKFKLVEHLLIQLEKQRATSNAGNEYMKHSDDEEEQSDEEENGGGSGGIQRP